MSHWQEKLEANPDDAYTHRRLGRAYEANGIMESAVKHYKVAIVLDPEYDFAKRDLGVALASTGKRSQGLALLQEVVKNDPNYAQAYCDIGDILAAERDWDGALWHYKVALSRDGDFHTTTAATLTATTYKVAAYRGIGVAYLAQGKLEEAVAKLKIAKELCPEDRLTQYHLGLALGEGQDTAEQVMPYPKEEWRYQNEQELRAGHVLDLAAADRPADMAALYRRAHRKDPTDPFAALRLGAALYQAQDSAHGHHGHLI